MRYRTYPFLHSAVSDMVPKQQAIGEHSILCVTDSLLCRGYISPPYFEFVLSPAVRGGSNTQFSFQNYFPILLCVAAYVMHSRVGKFPK